jgi:hypothetical protein
MQAMLYHIIGRGVYGIDLRGLSGVPYDVYKVESTLRCKANDGWVAGPEQVLSTFRSVRVCQSHWSFSELDWSFLLTALVALFVETGSQPCEQSTGSNEIYRCFAFLSSSGEIDASINLKLHQLPPEHRISWFRYTLQLCNGGEIVKG